MNLFPCTIKKIAFVALSGKPDREKVRQASSFLNKQGYEVILKDSINSCSDVSYLSSNIKTRVDDIHSCWADKSIDMVFAARGGYGSAQLLPYLDWKLLSKRRMPFIGYSDTTAIHLAMCSRGIEFPISGPMAHNFPLIEKDKYTFPSLYEAFSENQIIQPVPSDRKKFSIIKKGVAQGKIYPVTLSVFVSLIGTPYLPDLNSSILLIEDINEPVYKLDRYFTHLEQSGILSKISGLLLGNFLRCGTSFQRLILFKKIAEKVNGPVIMNIPFGHSYPRISVHFESMCRIEASQELCVIKLNNKQVRK